jgi:transcriptional regulator with XRE-family HTH domain
MMMRGSELIRLCRGYAGISLSQLAEKTGLHKSQINCWERGVHEPKFEYVLWMLDAMGFELELRRKK